MNVFMPLSFIAKGINFLFFPFVVDSELWWGREDFNHIVCCICEIKKCAFEKGTLYFMRYLKLHYFTSFFFFSR